MIALCTVLPIPIVELTKLFSKSSGERASVQLFLAGITAELDRHGDSVTIMLGGRTDRHISRVISSPRMVAWQPPVDGKNAALQITSTVGTATLLRML